MNIDAVIYDTMCEYGQKPDIVDRSNFVTELRQAMHVALMYQILELVERPVVYNQ